MLQLGGEVSPDTEQPQSANLKLSRELAVNVDDLQVKPVVVGIELEGDSVRIYLIKVNFNVFGVPVVTFCIWDLDRVDEIDELRSDHVLPVVDDCLVHAYSKPSRLSRS